MPSKARNELNNRLDDVEEVINAHTEITGGGRGKPARKQGAALTRAGVVLLAAAMEAYVEDLFEESARLVMADRSAEELKNFFVDTRKRLHNADIRKTQMLYFNLGIPWVLENIRWQKFSNEEFKKSIDSLVERRNQIAHGRRPGVRLAMLRKWKGVVEKYSEKLDEILAKYVCTSTGQRPW